MNTPNNFEGSDFQKKMTQTKVAFRGGHLMVTLKLP